MKITDKMRDEAIESALVFFKSLPSGWLRKLNGDIGSLNDFYCNPATMAIQHAIQAEKEEK